MIDFEMNSEKAAEFLPLKEPAEIGKKMDSFRMIGGSSRVAFTSIIPTRNFILLHFILSVSYDCGK